MNKEEIRLALFRLDKPETWLAEGIGESKQRLNYLLNAAKRIDNEMITKIDKFLSPLLLELEDDITNKTFNKNNNSGDGYKSSLPNLYNNYPVVSIVRTGVNKPVQETDIVEHIGFVYNKINNCVAVKVVGDSMLPRLSNGDYVLIDKDCYVEPSGNIVVAIFKDQTHTIKKYRELPGDLIELIPMNPLYQSRIVHKTEVEAVYKAVSAQVGL